MTRSNDTRTALIETTKALLWERGYAATSPRAILERAHVGQGSMYHHFSGKEELAVAAFERGAAGVLQRARDVLATDGTPLARISNYLMLQREILRGCPVGRMAGDADVLASAELAAILTAAFGQLRELIVSVLQEAVDAEELAHDADPRDLADTVLAVVQGGYVLARAAGDVAPFERAVRGAVSLLEVHSADGAAR
ncbi:TetR/AcrR family transcriptional regulator [Flexivirga caeni]|uniref:TetR/AcrR family transcriptional regulator n=1 Tax=Flexivirga caeni TaxID=2294115 RepID=UPI001FE5DC7B|nr:TetR/AcrR family transcriptional regulator [Flexivirga caeni]